MSPTAPLSVPLRPWQQDAANAFFASTGKDFLAVATPGAGKTTFALHVGSQLLARREITSITVVAPTEHLKFQWAAAAARMGISLDPTWAGNTGRTGRDFQGVIATYAGVAARTALHRNRVEARRSLVILDEIHHAGDALAWGESVQEAFGPAVKRLGLTGTPFRSDVNPIPYVGYEPMADGTKRSRADHVYGYAEALADGVVRPVIFLAYGGDARWRTSAGDELAVRLGEPMPPDLAARALRTALDPDGDWIASVLRAADQRLTAVRQQIPDAGGLVVATDQEHARAYGALLRKISGEAPVVVLSDDLGSGKGIDRFGVGKQRWLVAVRMVSEGVDIPRLLVEVFATTTLTPLFFAQAIGRAVRARRPGETASVFLPSIPVLLAHAAAMELERDHVLGRPSKPDDDIFAAEDRLLAEANRQRDNADSDSEPELFTAISSEAELDKVLFDGGEFDQQAPPGSLEEEEFLGIPGLLPPEHVSRLLKARRAEQAAARLPKATDSIERATHLRREDLRRELSSLVQTYARQSGQSAAHVHARLRAHSNGVSAAMETLDGLVERISTVRRWATGR